MTLPTRQEDYSVLLPLRDAHATLGPALESVLHQTTPAAELICVDDGSTDGSSELLDRYRRRHARIRVLRREGPEGDLVAALELGRRAVQTELVLRMDADDVAHPRRAERVHALFADPRVALAGCLVRSFPSVLVRPGRRRYDAWLNGLRRHEDMARERFVECPLAHPSASFRARAVEAVGGYRSFAGPEDYDLWLRLLAAGWRFGKAPRVLLGWREGPARLQRQDSRYGPAGMARARARALGVLLGKRPIQILGAGSAGKRLARELIREGARVTGFLDLDPRKLGRAPHGVPVLPYREELARAPEALIVSCVNAWGARSEVRALLNASGRAEGCDFFLGG